MLMVIVLMGGMRTVLRQGGTDARASVFGPGGCAPLVGRHSAAAAVVGGLGVGGGDAVVVVVGLFDAAKLETCKWMVKDVISNAHVIASIIILCEYGEKNKYYAYDYLYYSQTFLIYF